VNVPILSIEESATSRANSGAPDVVRMPPVGAFSSPCFFSSRAAHGLWTDAGGPHPGRNIGLMKAVKRFDPSADFRIVIVSVHWLPCVTPSFSCDTWRW